MAHLGGIEPMANVEEDTMAEASRDPHSHAMLENSSAYWISMVCPDVKRRVWNGVNGDTIRSRIHTP